MITLRTKGIPFGLDDFIVGMVTRDVMNVKAHHVLLLDENIPIPTGFAGIITVDNFAPELDTPCIFGVSSLDHLNEGDIVYMGEDGNIKTLYRIKSFHNMILATERCIATV